MDGFKEFELLKLHPLPTPTTAPPPGTISREDVVRIIVAFGDNSLKAIDVPSVCSPEDAQTLSSLGLPVQWERPKAPKKKKAAAVAEAADVDADGEKAEKDEKNDDEENAPAEEVKEEAKTNDVEPAAEAEAELPGKCVANTLAPHDKRIVTVGTAVALLMAMDASTPPAPVVVPSAEDAAAAAPFTRLSASTIAPTPLKIKGQVYKSPDHYFSAAKVDLFKGKEGADLRQQVLAADTANAARALVKQKLDNFDEARWIAARPPLLFAAALAVVRSQRPAYYELLGTGSAPISTSASSRQGWSAALANVRTLLQGHDFGACTAGHSGIAFLRGGARFAGAQGVKGQGLRLQQLCNEALNRPNAINFQHLLYALLNGRNLAAVVNRSGIVGLIADLLYKKTTNKELAKVLIAIVAELARQLGTIDKEIQGFLLEKFLHVRETWAALSATHYPPQTKNDTLLQSAVQNVLGTSSKFKADDLFIVSHSATVLSKLLSGKKAKDVVSNLAENHLSQLLAHLQASNQHCSVEGWNQAQEELGVAIIKILTVVTSYAKGKLELDYVNQLVPFLSPFFHEEIQAYAAVVLEQTKEALTAEATKSLLSLVKAEFVQLELPPPDRAEPLCDLLSALSPNDAAAAETLFDLGLNHFSSWALPVLAAVRNSVAAKSGMSTVDGFALRAAEILRQALDNSDESAVSNLCETAKIIIENTDSGAAVLKAAGLLSPFLQWVGEVELDVVKVEILQVCHLLSQGVVIAPAEDDEAKDGDAEDEGGNVHLLHLVVENVVNVVEPTAQSLLLQVLLNFADAGTAKATFEIELNLTALPKHVVKDNHKKANRLLHHLGIKTAAPANDAKPEKQQPQAAARQGSKKGEVDKMTYVSSSDNPFQLLVAKRPENTKKAATTTTAAAPKEKKATQGESKKPSKADKGFSVIAVKTMKKDPKKAEAAAGKMVSATNKVQQRTKTQRAFDRDYDQDGETRGTHAQQGHERPKAPQGLAPPKPVKAEPTKTTKEVQEGDYVKKVTGSGAVIKSRVAKEPAAPTPPAAVGSQVVKAKDRGGRGVNLNQIKEQLTGPKRAAAEPKKPSSWAALAKSANEKEEREAKAKADAERRERIAKEEAAKLEEMNRRAASAPKPVDPVSALFKQLLPSVAVRSVTANEHDLADLAEDKRRMNERAQRLAERDRLQRAAEKVKEEEEAARALQAERQRRDEEEARVRRQAEREAKVREELAAAESAAANVSLQFGMGTNSTWGNAGGGSSSHESFSTIGGAPKSTNTNPQSITSFFQQQPQQTQPQQLQQHQSLQHQQQPRMQLQPPKTQPVYHPSSHVQGQGGSTASHQQRFTDPWTAPAPAPAPAPQRPNPQPTQQFSVAGWQQHAQQQVAMQQAHWQMQQQQFQQQSGFTQSQPQPQPQQQQQQPQSRSAPRHQSQPDQSNYYATQQGQQQFSLNPGAGTFNRRL